MSEKEDQRTEHPWMPQPVTLQGRKEGDKHRSRTVPAEWPETAADRDIEVLERGEEQGWVA